MSGEATPVGPEFLVNTQTVDLQLSPTITGLANGGFVVAWTDNSSLGDGSGASIKAQVFSVAGDKIGSEFLVNTQAAFSQNFPSITGLANGGFVVTWFDSSATLGDVKGQVFSATGDKVGSEFLVNTETANDQTQPEVTDLAGGGFVVTWQDASGARGDPRFVSIKAQMFGAAGDKVGSELLVDTQTVGMGSYNPFEPTTTGLANGGFVVAWTDYDPLGDGSFSSVKAQMFGAAGDKVGSEFLVNTQAMFTQSSPTITGLANGGFVVAWQDTSGTLGDASRSSVKAQVFSAAGDKVGSEFLVNTGTTTGFQGAPTITGLTNGDFVVTWRDDSESTTSVGIVHIKAQVFSATGVPIGSEFMVNAPGGVQNGSTITGLTDGGFAIAWADNRLLGDGSDIKAQIYKADFGDEGDLSVSISPYGTVQAESNNAIRFEVSLSRKVAESDGLVSVDVLANPKNDGSGSTPLYNTVFGDHGDWKFASENPFDTRQTLTFAVGEQTKVVEITISDDNQIEPNETLTLGLDNASGAALAANGAFAYATIVNDDFGRSDTGKVVIDNKAQFDTEFVDKLQLDLQAAYDRISLAVGGLGQDFHIALRDAVPIDNGEIKIATGGAGLDPVEINGKIVYFPTALLKYRGLPTSGAVSDMQLTLDIKNSLNGNSLAAIYYGSADDPQHDMTTILEHEIMHGLGYGVSDVSGEKRETVWTVNVVDHVFASGSNHEIFLEDDDKHSVDPDHLMNQDNFFVERNVIGVDEEEALHRLGYRVIRGVEGPIYGGRLFSDDNENGRLDGNEDFLLTDERGMARKPLGFGTLGISGGIDQVTGLQFEGTLLAPADASVVTPLTTLIVELEKVAGSAAEAMVASALGLKFGLELTQFDPIAALEQGDADGAACYAAGVEVYIAAFSMARSLEQIGGSFDGAMSAAFSKMALVCASGPLDLGDAALVETILEQVAQSEGYDLAADAVREVVASVTGAAAKIQALLAEGGDNLLTELAEVEKAVLVAEPPSAPADLADAAIANGYVNGVANTAEQTLTGTAPVGATVTVYDGEIQLGTEIADAAGHFSFTLGKLDDGPHSLTATATNASGQVSVASAALNFTVDAAPPGAPTGLADAAVANGHVNAAHNIAAQTLTGVAEAGAMVTVYDGTTALGTANADVSTGNWSYTLGKLADGAHSLTATAADVAGNVGPASAALAFSVDSTAPTPSITNIVADRHGDGVLVTGISEPGSAVSLFDGKVLAGTSVANADGTWSLTLHAGGDDRGGVFALVARLLKGDLISLLGHRYTEQAIDEAGNVGGSSGVTIFGSTGVLPLVGTSGDDVLIGQRNDLMTGLGGRDRFVVNQDFGRQSILDFAPGTDQIQFDHRLFSSYADVMAHAKQVGRDVAIRYDSDDVLTLKSNTLSSLHAGDFVFV